MTRAFDDDTDRCESDAACVLCGELVGPTHWSRIYNRTVLCHDCERGLVRDVVPPAAVVTKKARLTH
jgi:hypothetical protein